MSHPTRNFSAGDFRWYQESHSISAGMVKLHVGHADASDLLIPPGETPGKTIQLTSDEGHVTELELRRTVVFSRASVVAWEYEDVSASWIVFIYND
jgi:hypothetical protein